MIEVKIILVQHHPRYQPGFPAGDWSHAVRHSTWVLEYADCAGLYAKAGDGDPFLWTPATWHIYGPGVPYWTRYSHPIREHEDMWIQFTSQGSLGALTGRTLTVLADPEERIADPVRALYAVQEQGEPGSDLILHGGLLAILGETFAAASRGNAGTPEDPWRVAGTERDHSGRDPRLLNRVDRIVTSRLSRPPPLDDLAERLGMSVSSLVHRYKAETGWSVIQRIRWLRIREARRLLAEPEANVKEVARKLGFSSPFYLSKVFKEISGVTPRDFLRQQRRGRPQLEPEA